MTDGFVLGVFLGLFGILVVNRKLMYMYIYRKLKRVPTEGDIRWIWIGKTYTPQLYTSNEWRNIKT